MRNLRIRQTMRVLRRQPPLRLGRELARMERLATPEELLALRQSPLPDPGKTAPPAPPVR